MQRRALPDPVLGRDRGAALLLGDIHRRPGVHDRDIDGLVDLARQLPADGAAFAREVQPGGRRPGQPHDAEAEPVLASLAELLDQAVLLKGAEEPERGGLVDVQPAGDLGDTQLAGLGQHLKDGQGPVHRLHRGSRADPIPAVNSGLLRVAHQIVSHPATLFA